MEHITDFICKHKIQQEILYVESYNTAVIFSLIGITGLFYGLYNNYKIKTLQTLLKKNEIFKENAKKIYNDLVDITEDINMDESDYESSSDEEEDLEMEEVKL